VRDIFLVTKCGSRCLDRNIMQSDKVRFIEPGSKEYNSIKILFSAHRSIDDTYK